MARLAWKKDISLNLYTSVEKDQIIEIYEKNLGFPLDFWSLSRFQITTTVFQRQNPYRMVNS